MVKGAPAFSGEREAELRKQGRTLRMCAFADASSHVVDVFMRGGTPLGRRYDLIETTRLKRRCVIWSVHLNRVANEHY